MNQTPSENDLVFRLSGGRRDGERLAVSSAKCLLPTGCSDDASRSHLVVFRGAQGVAVYSPAESLSVNGVESSVHWLNLGDRIQLHESMEAVVEQLGAIIDSSLDEDFEGFPTPETSLVDPGEPQVRFNEGANSDATSESQVTGAEVTSEPMAQAAMDAADTQAPTAQEDVVSSTPAEEPEYYSLAADNNQEEIVRYVPEAIAAEPESRVEGDASKADRDLLNAEQASAEPVAEFFPKENEAVNELTNLLTHSSLVDGPSFPETGTTDSVSEPEQVPVAAPSDESTGHAGDQHMVLEGFGSRLLDELVREREVSGDAVESPDSAAMAEAEAVEPEPEERPAPAGPKETVAELLARMKSEGQWQGLPDQEAGEVAPAKAISEPTVVNSGPSREAQVAAVLATESGGGDEDLDDYMLRLLTRMNGGTPSAKPKPVEAGVNKSKPVKEKSTVKDVLIEFVPPENPLAPDEFVPKQKADPPASLDAMRELANLTARTAVMLSERSQRKALATLQLAIGVCSFVMSLYYFLIGSSRFGDADSLLGLICLAVSGVLAYRYYHTMLRNELLTKAENKAIWPAGVPCEDGQAAALLPESEGHDVESAS